MYSKQSYDYVKNRNVSHLHKMWNATEHIHRQETSLREAAVIKGELLIGELGRH